MIHLHTPFQKSSTSFTSFRLAEIRTRRIYKREKAACKQSTQLSILWTWSAASRVLDSQVQNSPCKHVQDTYVTNISCLWWSLKVKSLISQVFIKCNAISHLNVQLQKSNNLIHTTKNLFDLRNVTIHHKTRFPRYNIFVHPTLSVVEYSSGYLLFNTLI